MALEPKNCDKRREGRDREAVWPAGDSTMAARFRATDWAKTALGPTADWPEPLKTAVDIMLAAASPLGIYWGPDFILLHNDAFIPILEGRQQRAFGYPAREVFQEFWDELEPTFVDVFSGKGATKRQDQKYAMRRHGCLEEVWFDYSLNPIPNADGSVGGILNIAAETTARVRSERALQASEAKFRAVFEQAAIGMGRVDLDSACWIDVNEALCRLVGYSAEEMRVTPWPAITHPEDVELDLVPFRRMAAGELDSYTVEKRFIHKRGYPVWARLTLSLVRDGEGRPEYEIAVVEDVTESKQAEAALRRSRDELQQINTGLEEFAFVVSHDLKAPLRGVAALAGVVEEETAGKLDDADREYLRQMRERIARMDRLIEGLLSYARTGRGGEESGAWKVDLTALMRELVADLPTPPGFRVECDEPLPSLRGDPLQLRQLLQNLIGNAIAHHDRPAEGHLWIRAGDEGDRWCLVIADDGPGIPASLRDQVFRMFATSGQHGHTGIGLAVARKIVTGNGGSIEVEDNRPRGTRFLVRWPK